MKYAYKYWKYYDEHQDSFTPNFCFICLKLLFCINVLSDACMLYFIEWMYITFVAFLFFIILVIVFREEMWLMCYVNTRSIFSFAFCPEVKQDCPWRTSVDLRYSQVPELGHCSLYLFHMEASRSLLLLQG